MKAGLQFCTQALEKVKNLMIRANSPIHSSAAYAKSSLLGLDSVSHLSVLRTEYVSAEIQIELCLLN